MLVKKIGNKKIVLISCLVITIAAIFRLLWLEYKPIHFDESINGWFVMQVWKEGFFRYDPTNYHGPLLFYLFQLSELIFGFGLWSFRFVTACFGVAGIVIVLASYKKYGRAMIWAAFFMAISAAQVFYARSAIHESIFVFFQILFFLGYWNFISEKSARSVVMMIYGFFGIFLLKETFVIFLFSLALASLLVKWKKIFSFFKCHFSKSEQKNILLHFVVAFTFFLLMFSGWGLNWPGVLQAFTALMPWMSTGVKGAGHEKEFFYWMRFSYLFEWPYLLAMLSSPWLYLKNKSAPVRILVLFAWIDLLFYSAVPYKTPWCFMTVHWPFMLVLGFALEEILQVYKSKIVQLVSLLVIFVAVIQSVIQSLAVNFPAQIDLHHPYVYVQSTQSTKRFIDLLYAFVQKDPQKYNMSIQFSVEESWPYPYIMRNFTRIEYSHADQKIADNVDLLFSDSKYKEVVDAALKPAQYQSFLYNVRDSRDAIWVYYRKDTFGDLFAHDSFDK